MICLPFLILAFIFPPSATCSSNETDFRSLLAFKSAIDLDPVGALNSWNKITPFCSWNGVRCGRRHPDRVVALNLMSRGLVGSLSPHLGNLTFLKSITLQNNTFHGPIPQQISLLRRLQYVDFSNNSFVGPIPQNLSNCPDLSYLNLIDNNLSGDIPTDLGSMSKLQSLGLGKNTFSTPIPPFFGNITTLTKLSLRSGKFVGGIPVSLSQLRNLKFLQLSYNLLTGTIPSGVFNLSAMQYFAVAGNHLQGGLPSTMGLQFPNLMNLDLFQNQFSGPIPASISNASLLKSIQAHVNYFTGPVPGLGSLIHLQLLDFNSNIIADDVTFISSLTNSSKLERLQFKYNLLTGSLPDSITNLSRQLDTITLAYNNIHGKFPSGIGNLGNLALLSTAYNFLEGEIPVDIAKLSKLQELNLAGNRFSYEVKFSFANLSFLTHLYLFENNLSGNVPSSLGNCTNLLALGLSRNNFYGFVPREILSLSPISVALDLSHNALEGSIPHEVGSLIHLAALDLSNNKFSGAIPNTLSKCISLEKLYLEGNLLEGEIPPEFSALVVLEDLDLSMNNLSGGIPKLLGKLGLQKLNLSFNMLHGDVPSDGVFKNISSVSLEGNNGLCGGIPELKLPPCSSSMESNNKNLKMLKRILIPIVSVGIFLAIFALMLICKQRFSKKRETPSLPSLARIELMRLSYLELQKATGGFSEMNLLGFGRFGSVYKGIVGEGQTVVAVKVLSMSVRGASKSFMTECSALRNARHRNLLKILSVCVSIDVQGNEFKALVYEYRSNGSLEKWLHGGENTENSNLDMMQRLNIAINIAQAVEYLHFGSDISIVHGDLKPSNILLDEDMTAYVGDFGLAKIISDIFPLHESNSSTGIRGTIGYIPPEYGMRRMLLTEGDAYSYGIVLLEMFTNKRPTDDHLFEGHLNLHCYVSAALPDRAMEVVDPQLKSLIMNDEEILKECMSSILSIGVSCSKEMAGERMSMAVVVIELVKIQKLLRSFFI